MTQTDRQPYKGKTSEKMLDLQSKHGKKRSSFTCTSLILITCIYCLIIVNRSLKKYQLKIGFCDSAVFGISFVLMNRETNMNKLT